MFRRLALTCCVGCLFSIGNLTVAQMVQTTTPMNSIGSSFYEQFGVQWSLRGPNFFANFGGGVVPPFGNPDPNSGIRSGFGFGGGKTSGSIGFNFAQGSSRSISSTTPSITTMDGYPGSITSQTIRPFVTGITPVVGGYRYGAPTTDNASAQMFQSHQQAQAANLRSRSIANMEGKQRKAVEAFERGVEAESEGDLRKARANYRKALALDQGPLRRQIQMKMVARGWK